jgi:3-hydroxyacyl-CoA dehydrogenase
MTYAAVSLIIALDLNCMLCCCVHRACSDIGLHVGKNFVDSFPQRVYVSSIFPALVEAKRLGEKSGSGFYKVRRD